MGCDIHLVLEKRKDKKWVAIDTYTSHHRQFVCTRNYVLFAALAGVRGNGPAPRGLPDDVSDTAKILVDEWGIDGHSHSWLSLPEATKVWATHAYKLSEHAAKCPEGHFFNVDCSNGSGQKADDYRVVFWFDN